MNNNVQPPQPVGPPTVNYTVPPVQLVAPPVFYSTPQPSSSGRDIRKWYKARCVKGLCITIMVCGILCFITQLVNIGLKSSASVTGGGIFGGFFYILTASVGLYSAKSRTTCPIGAFLVLAILSTLITVFPLAVGAADIVITVKMYSYYEYDYTDYLDYYNDGIIKPYVMHRKDDTVFITKIVMNAVMLVAALLNFLLLIISTGFACHGLCQHSSPSGAVVVTGQVHYVTGPNGQQQMMIIPYGGQPQPTPTTLTPATMLTYDQNWTGATAPGTTAPVHPPEYGRQPSPPPQYKAKEQLPSIVG